MIAIAYHTSKGHAIASYGPSVGVAFGAYRMWATKEGFRWPFYGNLKSEELGKGVWDGQALRIGGREILRNLSPAAKANLLHGLRGSAYASIGLLIVPMFVSAYGATVSAVGEIRDQRLEGVTRELRRLANMNLQGRKQGAVERSTGQGGKSMGDVWKERRERMGGDEGSPVGGVDGGENEERARLEGKGDMVGVLGDGQMRVEEMRARPDAETVRGSPENIASTFQMEKAERQPRSFADDYDDASPTGGSGAGGVGDGGGEGGSVWERIRSQSANGTPSASSSTRGRRTTIRQEQQEGSNTGDSFSFSSSEEERSYAKDEAQKEFDERVEKERRGGEFSSGSDKRW